jgi:hypothetical protein
LVWVVVALGADEVDCAGGGAAAALAVDSSRARAAAAAPDFFVEVNRDVFMWCSFFDLLAYLTMLKVKAGFKSSGNLRRQLRALARGRL